MKDRKNSAEDRRADDGRQRRGEKGVAVSRSGARRRRRLIGANVAVATILAASLLVAVNVLGWWLTDHYDLTADVTSDRTHSLSQRSRKVLGELEGKVYLTSLHSPKESGGGGGGGEYDSRRSREVYDLLRQYERLGADVEVRQIDPIRDTESFAVVGRRLTELYREETRPYEALIDDFLGYQPQLEEFLGGYRDRFLRAAKLTEDETLRRQLQQIADVFAAMIADRPVAGGGTINLVEVASQMEILLARGAAGAGGVGGSGGNLAGQGSGYGIQFFSVAAKYTADVSQALASQLKIASAMIDRQLRTQGMRLAGPLREMLEPVQADFSAVESKLVSFSDRLSELPPLELDQLLGRLAVGSVLIEAGGRAAVVTAEELYPPVQQMAEQAAEAVFAGEEAVTAALLRLTVADRPVAMFVKSGGSLISERLPEFKALVEQLRQSNFVIENWDLSQSERMPRPESDGPIVLIVMVPDQTNPALRLPPARKEDYAPVLEFMQSGGDVLLLTRGSLPNRPIESLPYDHLIEAAGLKVRLDMQTVQLIETAAGRQQATPSFEMVEYPREGFGGEKSQLHPIIRPLQGMRGRFDFALPVVEADERPEGHKWWPLVQTPERADIWGESNVRGFLQGQDQQYDDDADMKSPFAIAAASVVLREVESPAAVSDQEEESWSPEVPGSRRAAEAARRASENATLSIAEAVAGPEEGRAVVFGGDLFIRSGYLESRDQNNMRNFPANAELFINAMYWLSGREDMIGVGPQAQQSRRLMAMGSARTAINWLLWLGMPLAVLLIGGGVWYSRRR